MENGDNVQSAKELHDFALTHMPKHLIHNINNKPQMEERLLSTDKPAVLLLTDKYETSSTLFSLAYQFRKDFTFGESRAKNINMAKEFSVKKYPHLVVLDKNLFEIKLDKNKILFVISCDSIPTMQTPGKSAQHPFWAPNYHNTFSFIVCRGAR